MPARDPLEHGAERDAGQQQPHRRGASAADGGEGVDEQHRHATPAKREPDVGGDAGQPEQADRDDDEQPGAGVDPEDLGVGERVAGHRLDDGAGDAERGADEDRQDGPRHPQVAHDRLVAGAGVVRERVPDRGRGQVLGADDDAQQAAPRRAPRRTRRAPARAGRWWRPAPPVASAMPSGVLGAVGGSRCRAPRPARVPGRGGPW